MKILNKIMDGITAILFFLFIGGLILYVIGIHPFVVMSGSMEPSIHTGSVCFVNTNIDYAMIKKGDVIAFSTGTSFVTHRVIDVTDHGLETQGDANDISDGISVIEENFEGKTLFSIPYAGYLVKFIQTLSGKIICFTIFIVLILASFLIKDNLQK